MLDALARQLRSVEAWRLPWLIDELTPIASPKVDAILKLLLAKKKVATRAQAALDERRGKANKSGKPAKRAAAPKRPTTTEIERRFDQLSAWLAKELAAVRGKKAQEKKLLAEGAQRYAAIRSNIDLPTEENLVHFFGADGCSWKRHRAPALQRLDRRTPSSRGGPTISARCRRAAGPRFR